MKVGLSALSIVLIFFLILGCRKKETAGTGGEYSLVLTVRHHSLPIDSGKVYIKYNAVDAPASLDLYEDSKAILENENGVTQVTFSGLQKGEYYLYGTGWDPSIFKVVKGGLPYEIKNGEKTINLNLQVTEEGP